VGNPPGGGGFSLEVPGMRTSDYDIEKACGKKYERTEKRLEIERFLC
jgi:hypothetical protein